MVRGLSSVYLHIMFRPTVHHITSIQHKNEVVQTETDKPTAWKHTLVFWKELPFGHTGLLVSLCWCGWLVFVVLLSVFYCRYRAGCSDVEGTEKQFTNSPQDLEVRSRGQQLPGRTGRRHTLSSCCPSVFLYSPPFSLTLPSTLFG